jgi:phosphoglycerol transferase MdoB-like AlkP superfamily enzyme
MPTDQVQLDYASPKPKRKFSFRPMSLWIALFQFPYGFLFGIFSAISSMGQKKSLLYDSISYFVVDAMALVAIAMFLWELRRKTRRTMDSTRRLLAVVGLVISLAWTGFLFHDWYVNVWEDPSGVWSAL